jgi:hypothetical protein
MLLSQAYVGAPTGSATSDELAKLLDLSADSNEAYLYNYLRVLDSLHQVGRFLFCSSIL